MNKGFFNMEVIESYPTKKKKKFDYSFIITIITLTVVIFFSVKLVKSFIRHKSVVEISEDYGDCYSAMALIDDAIARYSKDHKGNYPKSLDALVPKYLKKIPKCPIAGRDTYSKSYKMISKPSMYFFCCQGKNHKDKPDTPQIVSDLSFYPDKYEDPVMYVYENGNMPYIMDTLSQTFYYMGKGNYNAALESIDELLKIQVQRRDFLFVTKSYCLFKLKRNDEALESLKKSLEIDFRYEDWKKIMPFIDNLENRWKVSDLLHSYVSSKKNLSAVILIMNLNRDSSNNEFWEDICNKGLEFVSDETTSLLPEFYFRGKLALISGNKQKARYFFNSVLERASGSDFNDSVVSSLSAQELEKIKAK